MFTSGGNGCLESEEYQRSVLYMRGTKIPTQGNPSSWREANTSLSKQTQEAMNTWTRSSIQTRAQTRTTGSVPCQQQSKCVVLRAVSNAHANFGISLLEATKTSGKLDRGISTLKCPVERQDSATQRRNVSHDEALSTHTPAIKCETQEIFVHNESSCVLLDGKRYALVDLTFTALRLSLAYLI